MENFALRGAGNANALFELSIAGDIKGMLAHKISRDAVHIYKYCLRRMELCLFSSCSSSNIVQTLNKDEILRTLPGNHRFILPIVSSASESFLLELLLKTENEAAYIRAGQ